MRAKSVILVSRSGMDATGVADAIKALETPGVVINVRKCDVTDKENRSAILQECARTLPPIRGVIQGAMVLNASPKNVLHLRKADTVFG